MAKTVVSPESAAFAQVDSRTRSRSGETSGVVLDIAAPCGSALALQACMEGVLLILEARARYGSARTCPWKR